MEAGLGNFVWKEAVLGGFLSGGMGPELSRGGCDSGVYKEMGGSKCSPGTEPKIFQVRGGLVFQEEHLRVRARILLGRRLCVCVCVCRTQDGRRGSRLGEHWP